MTDHLIGYDHASYCGGDSEPVRVHFPTASLGLDTQEYIDINWHQQLVIVGAWTCCVGEPKVEVEP
jgi:hypothetical protein